MFSEDSIKPCVGGEAGGRILSSKTSWASQKIEIRWWKVLVAGEGQIGCLMDFGKYGLVWMLPE